MNHILLSEQFANYIGFCGVLIMCIGSARSAYDFIRSNYKNIDRMTEIRIILVKHLSLGLEFLVAKDIIDSIIEPTLARLGILAAIIALRTAIAFILHWELKLAKDYIHEETELEEALDQFKVIQAQHHEHSRKK
jgi:uncharacterized membrane protein